MARPAPAGEGTPVKYLARRKATAIAKMRDMIQPERPASWVDQRKITSAGATPKQRKSERLSSSEPSLLCAFKIRAAAPSKASMNAAITMAITAASHLLTMANLIEVMPAAMAVSVIMLGIT